MTPIDEIKKKLQVLRKQIRRLHSPMPFSDEEMGEIEYVMNNACDAIEKALERVEQS